MTACIAVVFALVTAQITVPLGHDRWNFFFSLFPIFFLLPERAPSNAAALGAARGI